MNAPDPVPQTEFQLLGYWLTPTEFWVVALVILAVYAVAKAAEAYEVFAQFVPFVGRKMQERKKRKVAARNVVIAAAVKEQLSSDSTDLRRELDELKARVKRLERDKSLTNDWQVYESEWHYELEREYASKGWVLKPHLTFPEYEAKWNTGLRYDNGEWHKP